MRLFFSCLAILGINMLGGWTASAAPSGITFQKIDLKTIEVAYLFEEGKGKTAQDISLNKRHGTLEGGVKYGPGKFGTGLVYDGKDGNLIVKGYRGLGGKQARTVLYWFKSASAREHSWVKWGPDEETKKYYVRAHLDGAKCYLRVENAGGNNWGDTDVCDGKWHHHAVVFPNGAKDVQDHNIYVDGKLNAKFGEANAMDTNNKAQEVVMGDSLSHHAFMHGSFDEVAIFNVDLTAEQIQLIMTQGLASALEPIYVTLVKMEPFTIGDIFSLDLLSSVSTELHHFNFDLDFDPGVLKGISVDYGSILSNNGADPITCSTPDIDNVTGKITGISCQRNMASGITGSGVLALVNFEAVGVGQSPITIEKETFYDPTDKPIESATGQSQITVYGPHAKITGRIIDAQGQTVPGVKVIAFLDDQPIGINGQTGSNGSYLIDNLTSAGRVTVKAIKPGLMPIESIDTDTQIGEITKGVDFVVFDPTPLRSVVDEEGFVHNWLIIGPVSWENDTTRLIADQLNPKTDPDSRLPVQEADSKDLTPKDSDLGTGLASNQKWTLHVDDDRRINLDRIYGEKKGVAYASTWVRSEQEREITLEVGHNDGVMVWLNGQLVHLEAKAIGWYPDRTDQIKKLTLKKGWNRLLLKIGNRGGSWGFQARFVQQATPLLEPEPLANLEVAPQGIDRQTEADTPSGLTRGTFKLELEEGLNMISLPVQPDNPMTSKSLANEIGATLVIHLDPKTKAFVPFVPEQYEGTNFEIQGGMGVIVNVRRSQTVNFTGTVWDNTAAAPGELPAVWAFGLVFEGQPIHALLNIRNLRSGEQAYTPAHTPAIAFVDQSQQAVVDEGDTIEIQTEDLRWRYRLKAQDLQNAFARVVLDQRIQVPNRTQLLANYPNPFNPETWIPFQLAEDSTVTAKIYDVTGKQIRMIELGHIPAGNYVESNRAIYWDGKTETGEAVSSGTYFYQIQAGDYTETRKMVILK